MHYDTGVIEQIVVIFVIASFTQLFWKGVAYLAVLVLT